MHYTILVDRNENVRQIEMQEQSRFLKTVLEALEIENSFNPDEQFSVQDKIKLLSQLHKYSITAIDDLRGGLKIFAERELVAEWKKPSYKLKQKIGTNNIYTEMTVDFWIIFEEDQGGGAP